jgi:hypothetical protein
MFHLDRNKLVSKFASSAAHVTGKNLAAAETGTWLTEHFTETLADMKYLLDDMFLSGINHVFYHGTCYSPDEAGWPGWVFYASYEMNPRNSVWHDVAELNAYAARCQAVLQAGRPDNDVLIYWPIHDLWHNMAGTVQPLTVHARDWFEGQPIGKLAERLWARGYAFDYVSDRQLAGAGVQSGRITLGGGDYRVVVVPEAQHIPLNTLRKLVELAKAGATVVFEEAVPSEVPGFGRLDERRAELKNLLAEVQAAHAWVGDVEPVLAEVGVPREPMFDQAGLMCVRRAFEGGRYYFIANRSEQKSISEWVQLGRATKSASIMDALTCQVGSASVRQNKARSEVYLQVPPGGSLLLRCEDNEHTAAEANWAYWDVCGTPAAITGTWHCKFTQGGPELPGEFQTQRLASWTELGDTNAQRFAGSAIYTIEFAAPKETALVWQIDLGKVCQSARVRLNGRDLGTLITQPFRVATGALKLEHNVLEVEVTNTSANRIRDLDRCGVKWKNFYDINIVSLDYKPFDASNWPVADSGLLGPVTLTPVKGLKIEN